MTFPVNFQVSDCVFIISSQSSCFWLCFRNFWPIFKFFFQPF